MSGPKTSSYQVDQEVLKRIMLEQQHQQKMRDIQRQAREAADRIMASCCTPPVQKRENALNNPHICAVFSEISDIIAFGGLTDSEMLTAMQLRDRLTSLSSTCGMEEIEKIRTEFYGSFRSAITALPEIKAKEAAANTEKAVSDSIRAEYESSVAEYFSELMLIDEECPHIEPPQQDGFMEATEIIRAKTAELKRVRMEKEEQKYIYETAAAVMKEMGYDLYGEKKRTNASGDIVTALFPIDEKTAYSITSTPDGKFVFEVTGYNSGGITGEELKDSVEEAMKNLCGKDYLEFERQMKQHGITYRESPRILPPSRQFAKIQDIDSFTPVSADSRKNCGNTNAAAKHHKRIIKNEAN